MKTGKVERGRGHTQDEEAKDAVYWKDVKVGFWSRSRRMKGRGHLVKCN